MTELSAPNAALWRSPHRFRAYLYIDRPEVVFAARVNQASFTYPLAQVTFDGVTTGAYTDVLPGFTVLFGSSAGADDLGRQRVRKDPTSTILYIGESSQGDHDGEVDLADNVYITVLNERRVWTIPPRYDKDTKIAYKDYEIEVDSGGRNYATHPGPKANGGAWRVALVDPDTDLATFDFSDLSLAATPLSTIASRVWDVKDGTITVGTSADADITATFGLGRRYVELTVTDSNGHTHTQYILVVALSLTDITWKPIQIFECPSRRLLQSDGEMTVIIHEDIPATTYYDGAAVLYFKQEIYGTTSGSLAGPATIEHVKFVGFLDTEIESPTSSLRGIQNGTELRCISPMERLRQLNLLPQLIKRKNNPDEWDEIKSLTYARVLFYLLRWHSTILDLMPLYLVGNSWETELNRWATPASTLYDQAVEAAKARGWLFTCDSRGILRTVPHNMLRTSLERSTTVIVALSDGDAVSVDLERNRAPNTYWVDGSAITVGSDTEDVEALFARAPGDAPGQGSQRTPLAGVIVNDQDNLNIWTGNEYARINAPWQPVRIRLKYTGDAGIEPALGEWITLSLGASTNRRARSFSTQRCLPIEINFTQQDNPARTEEVELIVLVETEGAPAATVNIAKGGGNNIIYGTVNVTPYSTPVPAAPGGPGAFQLYRGTKKIAGFNMDGYVYITPGFELSPPRWTHYDLGLAAGTSAKKLYDFVVDPFSPGYLGTGTEVNGWIAGGDGIYRIEDTFGARTVTLQKSLGGTLAHPVEGRVINCGWGFEGWVMCSSYRTDGVFVTYTTDGATWAAEQRVGHNGAFTAGASPGLHVSSKVPGRAYLHSIYDGIASSQGYISTDYGANWAAITPGVNGPDMTSFHPSQIHVPYHDNDDEMLAYWSWLSGASEPFTLHLYRTEADGTTITEITPSVGSGEYRSRGSKWVVYTCPIDRRSLVAGIVDDSVVASAAFGLVGSRDGGDTWFDIITPVTGANNWIQGAALSGNDENILYAWGNQGHMWYSQNPGVTLDDKRGNILADYPSVDRFVAICGG